MKKPLITKRILVSVFLRSFFIQAVWNYRSLLSIGFIFAILPAIKRIYKTNEERVKVVLRHLNFFNAQPYFASFALGAIIRSEEDLYEKKVQDATNIERLKNALIGPLGAVGDQLFWAAIKPGTLLAGTAAILIIPTPAGQLLSLVTLLLFYNIPHIYMRWTGIMKGYRLGFDVYKLLNIEKFKILRSIYLGLGAATLGVIIGFYSVTQLREDFRYMVVFVLSIGASYFYQRKFKSQYAGVLIILILAIGAGFVITIS